MYINMDKMNNVVCSAGVTTGSLQVKAQQYVFKHLQVVNKIGGSTALHSLL